jgi:hypothetical protein|tara:strand:- start:1256 stop:1471 length:216 start_codon:yes stop_codon:yes gene_type:complete
MSEKQTLKFTIRQDGYVTEEVTGVQGTQCVNLTEKIENELGDIQWRKETPDYYKQENLQKDVTLQYDQNKD